MENNQSNRVSYLRFFAMIGTSMVIMYILMYVNSYQILDGVYPFWWTLNYEADGNRP